MFSFLIIACLVQLWLIFAKRENFAEVRLPLIKAAVIIFALIFFNTEFLSLFNAVTARNVFCLWLFENIFCFGVLLFFKRNETLKLPAKDIFFQFKEIFSLHREYLIILLSLYLVVFFVALISVPNTTDSQTYHLARVANWIQWANVDFYPTSTLRQLYSNPLAEYGVLNIFLLSGNDKFANLLQFACFIGCGLAVSLIVREFELDHKWQIFSMLLTATIPMAILQASSTQNDLVISFLTLCFFLFYLRFSKAESVERGDLVICALSLGLAFLTKGTAYIYCAATGMIIFATVVFQRRLTKQKKFGFFLQSILILFIALSVNSIQYTRNFRLFGSPLATGEESYINENLTVKKAAAGVVKNYVIHLGTYLDESSTWLNQLTSDLLGDEITNPDTQFLGMGFSIGYSDDETSAGNFLQMILLTFSLFCLLAYTKKMNGNTFITAFVVIIGFVLLSALLKWNPYLSRLHTPFFILGCAVITAVLSKLNDRVSHIILLFCLLSGANVLLMGHPRSILTVVSSFSSETPRINYYFANNMGIADAYINAMNFLKGKNPQEIGLMLESDYRNYTYGDWEYPMWLLLKDDFAATPLIRHVGLKNISNRLIKESDMPEWIVTIENENTVGGIEYDEVWNEKPLRILKKRSR